jgi:hypothetical protein
MWYAVYALMLLTLMMIGLKFTQDRIGRNDRNAARARPELSIEKASVIFTVNEVPMIEMMIVNRGKSGAYQIAFRVNYSIVEIGTVLGYPPTGQAEDIYPHIASEAVVRIASVTGMPISAEMLLDIKNGKRNFFWHIQMTYKDEEDGEFGIALIFMYEPKWNDLRIAPPEYWPKAKGDRG